MSVDTSAALALPGVAAWIDAKDVPAGGSNMDVAFRDAVFADGKVEYMGQRIGLVLAETQVRCQIALSVSLPLSLSLSLSLSLELSLFLSLPLPLYLPLSPPFLRARSLASGRQYQHGCCFPGRCIC